MGSFLRGGMGWITVHGRSLGVFSRTTSWRSVEREIGRPWHFEHSHPLVYFYFNRV